jgi:hypothetical protein
VEKPQPNYVRDGAFIVVMLLAVLLFEIFSGNSEEVRTYTVPKEKTAPHSASTTQSAPAKPDPESLIRFAKPDGWMDATDAAGLTTFSFVLPGNAGVSAIPLPARLAENPMIVNMWREQVGLGPADEATLQTLAKPIQIGGHPGRLYDIAGTKPLAGQDTPPRIITASLVLGQVGWFFKLSGPAETVDPHYGTFTNFLATLQFQPEASEVNFDRLMAEAEAARPPAAAPTAPSPTWAKPDGWAAKPPTSMRLGNFTAGNGKAEITVMTFPGDVGGLLANVNRWRGQSGLPTVNADGLADATTQQIVSETPATVVEAIGDKTGSISVYHPVNGQTWFYKISGPSAVVTAEKGAFMEFIQSIQFPKP